jgi:hypothetical protein
MGALSTSSDFATPCTYPRAYTTHRTVAIPAINKPRRAPRGEYQRFIAAPPQKSVALLPIQPVQELHQY